jgi:hypothetical protein
VTKQGDKIREHNVNESNTSYINVIHPKAAVPPQNERHKADVSEEICVLQYFHAGASLL